jgi:hypothetical protein
MLGDESVGECRGKTQGTPQGVLELTARSMKTPVP